ncbi:MAG: malto-oligosyltrehalose synthase [Candidatus Acidiferrum sp.]|jgi:(1->4)-alpha-D-glucan 1-alpha-D-glucosylmutase
MAAARIPIATYRLQFHREFRFADASKVLDYLAALGISDVYASPILTSRRGSTHGYDGTDPTRIDPDLGTEEEFAAFQQELQKRGMGLLLDVVPNHMAASSENRWWMEVLENGPDSAFASYFDVDWHPGWKSMDGRILLPVLGKPFGEVLDAGEFSVVLDDGKFFIRYFEQVFPVAPRSYRGILQRAEEPLRAFFGEHSSSFQEYAGILSGLEAFAAGERRQAGSERRSRFASLHERLRELLKNQGAARIIIDRLAEMNGDKNSPASFNALHALLAEQHYKLAYWQNVNESINYRRFFAITELVGLRVEDPMVFGALHDPLLRLVSKDVLSGLRVDHIDGLKDPAAYLARLQQRLAGPDSPAPDDAGGDRSAKSPRAYVLVEKILARGETLPQDWPVSGTTGYEYLNFANDLFVDPSNARKIEEIYATFTGKDAKFADVLYQKKKLVMNTLLGVEMRSLGRQLGELAAQDRYAGELPRPSLLEALIETTACVPAYRTYVRSLDIPAPARDFIERAVGEARARKPHLDPACFDFLRDVLLLANPPHVLPGQREARLAFVMRWQQFTGPIVAKGVEDTALYVYHPLLSLNEVGGDPQVTMASSEKEFWNFLRLRREHWPHGLNASTTHDTKRSEDVRARINVLSEIPQEWETRLHRWAAWNAKHKTQVDGQMVPDRNEEYFLYQTLLGAWPLEEHNDPALQRSMEPSFVARIQEYLAKAIREAMVHTRWTRPNEAHETALHDFVATILSPQSAPEFLADLREFEKSLAYCGMVNGLAQTLLKMTAPGVPDFFQGSELWDLRLVDPDNRTPVDFARRISELKELQQETTAPSHEPATVKIRKLLKRWPDGGIKLFLIRKILGYRRQHAALFADGEFLPTEVRGPASEKVMAFFRCHENEWSLSVVPRWLAREKAGDGTWRGTAIVVPKNAPEAWTNVLTGALNKVHAADKEHLLDVGDVLGDFPVALLGALSGLAAV